MTRPRQKRLPQKLKSPFGDKSLDPIVDPPRPVEPDVPLPENTFLAIREDNTSLDMIPPNRRDFFRAGPDTPDANFQSGLTKEQLDILLRVLQGEDVGAKSPFIPQDQPVLVVPSSLKKMDKQ